MNILDQSASNSEQALAGPAAAPASAIANSRRTVLRGLAAGSVAAGAVAASAGTADAATSPLKKYVNTPLWKGMKGPTVKVLQKALKMPKAKQNGVFGQSTKDAVKAYQRKHRLPVTGVVNNATWRVLAGMPSAAAEAAAKKKAAAAAKARKVAAEKKAREAKRRADAAARAKAAAEAKAKAEAARKAAEEAKRKAEEEAKRKAAEEEAKRKAAEAAAKAAAAAALAAAEVSAREANAARRKALLASTTTAPHTPGLTLAVDPVWHLVRRVTYGPTPNLVADVKKMGVTTWLNQQLNPASIDDSACDSIISKTWPLLNLEPAKFWDIKDERGAIVGTNYSNYWMRHVPLARALFSKRQIFEMTVGMWHDLLHITLGSEKCYGVVPSYDAMIRKHAFGTFEGMLQAAITHPAMLRYLDNHMSSKFGPNENLGRELLELHTVGLGEYTEADVKASANILTGHSVDSVTKDYSYKAGWHVTGPVKVMGFSHPNTLGTDGPAVLAAYLKYLANHPATARKIAERMCRRFVSDAPSATLVADVAKVFTANKTAIVPTLRYLFNHAEFKAATGLKFRRPDEYLLAIYRAGGPTWTPPTKGTGPGEGGVTYPCNYVYGDLLKLGMETLAWPAPNGWPDVAPAWQSMSGFVVRANAPWYVLHNYDQTVKVNDWRTPFGITESMSAYEVVDRLTETITGFPFEIEHRDNLASFLWDGNGPTPPSFTAPITEGRLKARLDETIRLILASPYMNIR